MVGNVADRGQVRRLALRASSGHDVNRWLSPEGGIMQQRFAGRRVSQVRPDVAVLGSPAGHVIDQKGGAAPDSSGGKE